MAIEVKGVNGIGNTGWDVEKSKENVIAGSDTAAEKAKVQIVDKQAENCAKSGVIYEKGMNTGSSLYSINKMSQTDRTAIVDQLKADAEERKNQMMNLVQKTLTGQVGSFGKASGDDFWRTLASGKFTVDAATKAQAQKDISEDGYWGVKQTSQRLFDFASALAGDDVDKMKEMQSAMEKGFKQATKTWGRELPEISRNTLSAANKLFEDYYASKQSAETGTVTA